MLVEHKDNEGVVIPIRGEIANAFFDATGALVREYPMTPDRVRAALKT
jgi:CO/xanthine dehydrogenase Mo-binding subunit